LGGGPKILKNIFLKVVSLKNVFFGVLIEKLEKQQQKKPNRLGKIHSDPSLTFP
jgi:hypothetical protein